MASSRLEEAAKRIREALAANEYFRILQGEVERDPNLMSLNDMVRALAEGFEALTERFLELETP
jgi:hypothetical protein